MKQFYVYIYRDGDGIPFYVGKGHGTRAFNHLKGNRVNRGVDNKIKKMARLDQIPSIEITNAMDEGHAFFLEETLIWMFGRRDKKTGSLFNLTDGGQGTSGRIYTQAERDRVGVRMKVFHSGKPKSEVAKAKMSKWQKGQPKPTTTCPYCQKTGSQCNMKRDHFDNCRYNPAMQGKWESRKLKRVFSQEERQTQSLKLSGNQMASGTIWVNDGVRTRRIKPEEFDSTTMRKGRH